MCGDLNVLVVVIIILGYNFVIFLEDLNDDIFFVLIELIYLEERIIDILLFEEFLVYCDVLYELNEDGIRKFEF